MPSLFVSKFSEDRQILNYPREKLYSHCTAYYPSCSTNKSHKSRFPRVIHSDLDLFLCFGAHLFASLGWLHNFQHLQCTTGASERARSNPLASITLSGLGNGIAGSRRESGARKEQLFSCLRIASRLWGKGKRASSFRKGKKEILAIGYLTGSKSTRAEKAISRYIAISRRDRTRAMTPPSLLWGPPTVFLSRFNDSATTRLVWPLFTTCKPRGGPN